MDVWCAVLEITNPLANTFDQLHIALAYFLKAKVLKNVYILYIQE